METCGKDFEKWYYDEFGTPEYNENLECGFGGDVCDDCKKNDVPKQEEVTDE